MMINRRPQPVIGKVAGTWCSGGNLDSAISPRSPLEIMNLQSPKGQKKCDFVGGVGVGLGIVEALVKSEHSYISHHCESHKSVLNRNQSISNHVPVEIEKSEEDYTFVTCHRPNKSNIKVYPDDGSDHYGVVTRKNNTPCLDQKSAKKHICVFFDISSVRFPDDVEEFPDNDFLNFCHLCCKTLHGKDVYMYRGEKAFCSVECRNVEIVKDERKEKQKCRS